MSLEATAQALATDTAMPVEAPVTQEVSEDSELESMFDNMQDAPSDSTDKEPQVETDPEAALEVEAKAEPEATTEQVDAPSDVPYAIKQHWNDIPETARDAILKSQREMGQKLADQGRQVQGIAPIRDVLTQAVQDLPGLANMKPEDAAKEVFALAKLSSDFSTKPVETLMGYIQKHGLGEAIQAAMTGQPQAQTQQVPELMKHIQGLERKISEISDPEYIRGSFETFNTESQVQSSVTEFASKAEHWGDVEEHMPATIQFMQATLGDSASPQDVLSKAYELAVSQFVPEAKVKQEGSAEKAAPVVDPERSKAALKAKSANVQSSSSGKSRAMTEDELMSAAYDKMQN